MAWLVKKSPKHNAALAPTVHTLTPEEIAAVQDQCTPPSDITTRHGMNRMFISAPVDHRCTLRPRGVKDNEI